ncbi:WXG100 family type VII secretion target [Streptomyces sp. TP-A0874]|uniref:WXG100 family type VII secretion target n=1 Tax=Streptomyces sp. TP-A0874 TaxID=549819 RepID=UPI0008538D92|nr:WXG100 family type VII secretion target [Streptomyces sp. TP-A0874]
MGETGKLDVSSSELDQLVKDLDTMQDMLDEKIRSLNAVVDRIEGGWKGSAAGAYNELQRNVNNHARSIREKLVIVEEAMKMSRDGFDQQELDQLQQFQKLQAEPGGQSKILDLA